MRFALTLLSVATVAARSAWAKAVFAHFMVRSSWTCRAFQCLKFPKVANTDSFDEDQWKTEISAAKAIGIQGFGTICPLRLTVPHLTSSQFSTLLATPTSPTRSPQPTVPLSPLAASSSSSPSISRTHGASRRSPPTYLRTRPARRRTSGTTPYSFLRTPARPTGTRSGRVSRAR